MFLARPPGVVHTACSVCVQEDVSGRRAANGQQGWWLRNWLSSTTPSVAVAGAELGLWNFLATSCQVRGQPQALKRLWPGLGVHHHVLRW